MSGSEIAQSDGEITATITNHWGLRSHTQYQPSSERDKVMAYQLFL